MRLLPDEARADARHRTAMGRVLAALVDGTPDIGEVAVESLCRLLSAEGFTGTLRQHLPHGTIFAFTALPLHPFRRAGRDSVIMSR